MIEIISIATFVFEILTTGFYYNNRFLAAVSRQWVVLSFFAAGVAQYFINMLSIPYMNLVVFVLSYFVLGIFVYKLKIINALFHAGLLAGLMMSTEFIATFILNIFLDLDLSRLRENVLDYLVLSITAKVVYFISVYIVSKLFVKQKETAFVPQTLALLFLPLASVLVLIGMDKTDKAFQLDRGTLIIYLIAAVLLLYSNILVFAIYEHTIRLNIRNTELKLLSQKNEIDTEHYRTLQRQHNNTSILIHDINKHMAAVRDLAEVGDNAEIVDYINSVYEISEFDSMREFSANTLVNVIVNRFYSQFKDNDIDFYCDIRAIDFSFLKDSEITALLDNLLSNAYNATKTADQKHVDLTIKQKNQHYIVVAVENTCGEPPEKRNGQYISKTKSGTHGFGLKSIANIAKKHDGEFYTSFDSEKMLFKATVILYNVT